MFHDGNHKHTKPPAYPAQPSLAAAQVKASAHASKAEDSLGRLWLVTVHESAQLVVLLLMLAWQTAEVVAPQHAACGRQNGGEVVVVCGCARGMWKNA
eukprot:1157986-Pelagomonas_calceolata.AAC.1